MIFQLTHVYTWIGVVFTTKNLSSNRERLEQWEIPRCDFLFVKACLIITQRQDIAHRL